MDPPMSTRFVTLKGFDISDEATPGCLECDGDPPPPVIEADPPDVDAI